MSDSAAATDSTTEQKRPNLPLVFTAPRRGMPSRHLADLDKKGLREAVKALGLPAFRADQLARHYYARL